MWIIDRRNIDMKRGLSIYRKSMDNRHGKRRNTGIAGNASNNSFPIGTELRGAIRIEGESVRQQ